MSKSQRPQKRSALSILAFRRAAKDRKTVNRDGKPLVSPIHGVLVRPAITHVDERGSVCEMFSTAWRFDERPLVYVYQVSLLPKYVKGWVVHLDQDDRLFFSVGRMRVVLYDARKNSPTFKRLNTVQAGELNRCLLRIPAGVYHAIQNIGPSEAYFFNMPTKPYCHDNPDKFRLPPNNSIIPYRFPDAQGW